jgi:type 1 glutamine amidotransferase
MESVLLVSDGLVHPPVTGRAALRRLLGERVGCSLTHARSLESLRHLRDLERFQAIILYFHHRKLSPEALDLFEEFVRAGGGVLAIHCATASFKQVPRYAGILGGRFIGHGRVQMLSAEPAPGPAAGETDDPFRGLAGFAVRDELYLHELQPGARVHFSCRSGGALVPVIWTFRSGTGRVCCAALGHRAATLRNAAYGLVLRKGLAWAAG